MLLDVLPCRVDKVLCVAAAVHQELLRLLMALGKTLPGDELVRYADKLVRAGTEHCSKPDQDAHCFVCCRCALPTQASDGCTDDVFRGDELPPLVLVDHIK